jgi:hypothetical protein
MFPLQPVQRASPLPLPLHGEEGKILLVLVKFPVVNSPFLRGTLVMRHAATRIEAQDALSKRVKYRRNPC